jgi:hypothetical protein
MNKQMAKLRVCVENEFAHVGSLFAYVKFWRELKLGKQPVGSYYMIATLLKNVRVCLDGGNQTSLKFKCRPPSLMTYISSLLEQNERMVFSGEGDTSEDDDDEEEENIEDESTEDDTEYENDD